MEGGKVSENHLTSAAAFVEGGVQDACDDACSICLEAFPDNDPSSVTVCKHEFHLQCILEWGQRSSQCPMCWQSLSLKDPNSQELFDAVEHERNIRMNPPRNTTIFRHPTLGDFELQHLPVSSTDSELEERIIQHLAAAAAMGRARHLARRGGQRGRASSQGHPHFLVFSTNPNPSPTLPAFSTQRTGGEPASPVPVSGSTPPVVVGEGSGQFVALPSSAQMDSISGAGLSAGVGQLGTSSNNNRGSPSQSSPHNQNRAGPSDFQSFSESIKSRLSAMSMRYKESITKSTRGWKERFFSRNNNSMQDHDGSEARNEVSSDLATRETGRTPVSPLSNRSEDDLPHLLPDRSEQRISEIDGNRSLSEGNSQTPCATSSSH
ncbi:PREDICTED: E3 ubiquitin-protein ligase RHF2A-like [Ipomoea nil]|uniref:E3 ubiquitin-protein ligase RHF2A-like n=1 Tax=Ipomoea nil TaxID=35883 RepID=UPI000900F1EA|nr:PREDICTED: E3 ubiquitin-protein ligase RHF2A-like [Ipomoea nil]XP_019199549.1 PREDICTED: E3 ubiquitin-protein ligase RHF2A-like [Ipomoea nil]XP_019199550.1 PREDICTED: E3 ubiquitin-protein ligase RHF2A-like [Ipomoea nil]